jgi:UbiD family decarboxylase
MTPASHDFRVDDDIDIHNPGDVIWAMSTRSEPENIDVIRRC